MRVSKNQNLYLILRSLFILQLEYFSEYMCSACYYDFLHFLYRRLTWYFTNVVFISFLNQSECTYYHWIIPLLLLCFKFPYFLHIYLEVFISEKPVKCFPWNIFIIIYSDIQHVACLFFEVFVCYVYSICIYFSIWMNRKAP